MEMPFPSHQDGEMNSSCGVMPATIGTGSLFSPEEEDTEPKVLPETVVSEYSLRFPVCRCEIAL